MSRLLDHARRDHHARKMLITTTVALAPHANPVVLVLPVPLGKATITTMLEVRDKLLRVVRVKARARVSVADAAQAKGEEVPEDHAPTPTALLLPLLRVVLPDNADPVSPDLLVSVLPEPLLQTHCSLPIFLSTLMTAAFLRSLLGSTSRALTSYASATTAARVLVS